MEELREHKTWHSRGYIPHLDTPGVVQFVTFRLNDSMPNTIVNEWRRELNIRGNQASDNPRLTDLARRVDRYLDSGYGACWLGHDRIAEVVENAMLRFDGVRYRLLAWVVMPNHVHALIETLEGLPLGRTVHSWKSYSASQANRLIARRGRFWYPDYFDRYIRDDQHLAAVVAYIEENPVNAGLVKSTDEWRWGSAFNRVSIGE